jgi:twitching motility protein PilT
VNASRRLGEFLVERRVLARDALEACIAKADASGRPLTAILASGGFVGERDLVAAIAFETGQRFVDLDEHVVRPGLDRVVPAELARELHAVGVDVDGTDLVVAMVDPSDAGAVARLSEATGWPVKPALAVRASLNRLVDAMYGIDRDGPATLPSPGAPAPAGAATGPGAAPGPGSGAAGSPGRAEALPGAELHLNELLAKVLEVQGSDLHLTVGVPPSVRVRGELGRLDEYPVLNGTEIRRMVYGVLTQRQRERLEEDLELDFAHAVPSVGRFRVNVFFQRDSMGAVCRAIPFDILPLESLGLPASVGSFAQINRGLVLVTGPTGSGKSTTLASLIDQINRDRAVHIMTV